MVKILLCGAKRFGVKGVEKVSLLSGASIARAEKFPNFCLSLYSVLLIAICSFSLSRAHRHDPSIKTRSLLANTFNSSNFLLTLE